MTRSEDMPAVVTARDRERMRQLGAWKAILPPLSPPPPRTLEQVFAINERMRRMAGNPRCDDAVAVEEHVRFRAELQRLDFHGRTHPATGEMPTPPYASAAGETPPAEGSVARTGHAPADQ